MKRDDAVDLSLWQRERARRGKARRRRLMLGAGLAPVVVLALLLALFALGKLLAGLLGATPETREEQRVRRAAAATASLLRKLCAEGLLRDAQRCADLPSDDQIREMSR